MDFNELREFEKRVAEFKENINNRTAQDALELMEEIIGWIAEEEPQIIDNEWFCDRYR